MKSCWRLAWTTFFPKVGNLVRQAGPLSQLDFANWVSPDNHIKCMITGPLGMSSIGEMHGKACMITGSLGMSSIGEMRGKSQLQHAGTESVLRPPTRPAPQLARHCIYSLLAVAVVCFVCFILFNRGTGAKGKAQGSGAKQKQATGDAPGRAGRPQS